MPGNNRSRRSGQGIQRQSIPVCGNTIKDYLGQGYAIHQPFCERSLHSIGNTAEHKHGLSSTNGWAIGENKPACRDNAANLLQLPAKRLGRLPTHGAIHTQCQSIRNYEEIPIRAMDGIRTQGASTQAVKRPTTNRMAQGTVQRSAETSTRSHEKGTASMGKEGHVPTLSEE